MVWERGICTFLLGVFIAFCILAFMPFALPTTKSSTFSQMGAFLSLMLFGGLFVASTKLKCISLLVFVNVLGQTGRGFLRALTFALVISGAIHNLSTNGEEIVRMFNCSAYFTYNLTRTRLDLVMKPFQRTFITIANSTQEIKDTFGEVQLVVEPILTEVETDYENIDAEWNKTTPTRVRRVAFQELAIEAKYKTKLTQRCKMQLMRGKLRCKKIFADEHEKCLQKFLPIVRSVLCWPLRADFICNMNVFGNPNKVCDPTDALPDDFGSNYVNLKLAEEDLSNNATDVQIVHNTKGFDQLANMQHVHESFGQLMDEFHLRKRTFDFAMSILYHSLILLYLRIIIAAIQYHRKFQTDILFDNIYITEYFRHIDERRRTAGKSILLPLKWYEKKSLIDLNALCDRTTDESRTILFNIIQLTVEIVATSFFLLLDYIIVELMRIIKMRSLITYVQEGEHRIKFQVEGKGLMARLLRSTLKNFNIHEEISTVSSNETCLPNATALPKGFYIKLVLLYAAVFLLVLKSSIFLRMRRRICSHFYRKREKQRILYLYNSLLKQRASRFNIMLKNVQSKIANRRVRQQINPILKLRLKYPAALGCLRYFHFACRKCLICDAFEDHTFVICRNSDCGVAYCRDCWRELDTDCAACKHPIKTIQILNFDKFFEMPL